MRFDVVRLAEFDVDATAIGQPARLAGTEMFIRILNALVVLIFVLVLFRVRIPIAVMPEGIDELCALFVGLKFRIRLSLGVGHDGLDLFRPYGEDVIGFFFDSPRLLIGRLCRLSGLCRRFERDES